MQVNKAIVAHNYKGQARLYVHHDDEVFPNFFEDCAGFDEFGNAEFDDIRFQYDFRLHRESVEAVHEVGCSLRSFVPMVVYHQHVWWNYGYRLTLEEDGFFSFLLENLGLRANPGKEVPRGALGDNAPRVQGPPDVSSVVVHVGVKNSDGIFETVTVGEFVEAPLRTGYICNHLIKESEMKKLIGRNEFIILRVFMDIQKSYFDLAKILELQKPDGEDSDWMTPECRGLLEVVLTREKSPDSDFVFTRGSGANNDATSYHVHRNIVSKRSFMFEALFKKKYSLPTDMLLVVEAENRFIFPYLTDEDMKFLLTYFYTGEVILPEYDGFARVGRILTMLIDRDQLVAIFLDWQKMIYRNLLDLEKKKDNEQIVEESIKALLSVYSAPYGAMPFAKRMALSLLADQMVKSNEALAEKYDGKLFHEKYQVGHFMESALKLKRFVASVKKTPIPL